MRPSRLRPGVASLRERKRRHPRHQGQEQRRRAERNEQPPVAPLGSLTLQLEAAIGLVSGPPGEYRLGEHVVVDLVAGDTGLVGDGTDDSLLGQRLENGDKGVLLDVGVAGRAIDPDRGQMVEGVGHEILLRGIEPVQRKPQVVADDLLGAAERSQSREPKHV